MAILGKFQRYFTAPTSKIQNRLKSNEIHLEKRSNSTYVICGHPTHYFYKQPYFVYPLAPGSAQGYGRGE